MAEWRRRRLKIRRFFDILKDQVGRGLALATSSFPGTHLAIVMATSHDECPPEERHVQTILAAGRGSRLRVSYCTRTLVRRLTKTQNWAVALKCLIVLHRTLQEGGFLFQDHLSFFSNGTRDYFNLSNFKDDSGALAWALSSWVRRYARFLDERLICSKVLGSFLEIKGGAHEERIPYLSTEELLEDISALQALLQEAVKCEVDGIAAENDVVLGALRLVVRDSYSIQEETGCRIRELMERLDVLQLSEALQLLQVCRKASEQTGRLLAFCELCEACGIPEASQTPLKLEFMDSDLKKVTDAIKTAAEQPAFKSLLRAGSLQGSLGRLSFRVAQKRHTHVLARSRSSSSSSQHLGRGLQSSRAFARDDKHPARQQGVTHVGNVAGEALSSHAVPDDFLTGSTPEELERLDIAGAPTSSKAVIPMSGLQHMSSSFPYTRVSINGGQAPAAESLQEWERTLLESLGSSDPRSHGFYGSGAPLGIGLNSATRDSQSPWIAAPSSGGTWGHPGSAVFVPSKQQPLQTQDSVQQQQVTRPEWGSKSPFPDYLANLRPNYSGHADLPR